MGIFFSWKILCIGRNHIFQVKIWRNFAKEKHLLAMIFFSPENSARMRKKNSPEQNSQKIFRHY
jgi:hypothetical protein